MARFAIKLNEADLARLNFKFNKLKNLDRREFSKQIAITAKSAEATMIKKIKSIPFNNSLGGLAQGVNSEISNKKAVIENFKKYAPFIEFGTGREVDLTDMIDFGIPASYARQFKGRGFKGKKSVFMGSRIGWRTIQFPIHIKPKPFFFISIMQELKNLLSRLDKIIKNDIKCMKLYIISDKNIFYF